MCCTGFLRTCAPALCLLPSGPEVKFVLVQDSIPRGVIEVCWPCWDITLLTSRAAGIALHLGACMGISTYWGAQVNRCLSIKGAEDILNKPHAFEVSTTDDSMFFIADT